MHSHLIHSKTRLYLSDAHREIEQFEEQSVAHQIAHSNTSFDMYTKLQHVLLHAAELACKWTEPVVELGKV